MKVLHVIPYIASRYGGPSHAVITMCRALQSQGTELLIATTNANGPERLPVSLGKKIVYSEVPTVFFSRQWSEVFKYSRPFAQWLNKEVRNFDLVHIHDIFQHASLAAARACRVNHVPYIVRPLGTLDPWSLNHKWMRKKIFWHLGVARMLAEASAIHYTTAEEKRLAESKLGLTKGIVIPNGIDFSVLEKHTEPFSRKQIKISHNPYILALSRLHPKKGFEILIKSFAALRRQGMAAKWLLVFAGDGEAEYINQLKNIAAQEGVAGAVLFTGWLDGARKYDVLKDASLLALPSYQENFGICLIEALACGVPVLVSPYVNLASEIEAGGVGWIAEMNEGAIASVLAEAICNEQERRRRGERGRGFSQRFTASATAIKLQDLYQSLVRA